MQFQNKNANNYLFTKNLLFFHFIFIYRRSFVLFIYVQIQSLKLHNFFYKIAVDLHSKKSVRFVCGVMVIGELNVFTRTQNGGSDFYSGRNLLFSLDLEHGSDG